MNPLISVIIPVYNVELYLRKCINSVVTQTYSNLEIILVDDGSPDNCGAICDEYKKIDNRVIVIHKDNGGLSSARNAGLEICNGDYISFIDSDDFVSPYFIELLYESSKKHDADVVSFGPASIFKDELDVKFDEMNSSYSIKKTVKESLELMFYQKIPSGAQHRLYKKYIWKDLRFPNGDLFEEMATIYRTYLMSRNTAVVYGKHYAYRINPNGIVRMKFNEKKMVCIPVSQKTYRDIIDYDPSLEAAVASRMFSFNYQIFLQVPPNDYDNLQLLWNEMNKYRDSILHNNNKLLRQKNKIAAYIMWFGMDCAHKIGNRIIYKR